jgi:Domain of unknown function (DUF4430)
MGRALAAAAVALAIAGAACSVGPSQRGGAQLLVTREFGARELVSASEDPIESGETAMRILMRNALVKTRYGGRFVNAVNGVASSDSAGRRSDWFYYVNGIEADVGAAEHDLTGGDRVWWDYHEWSEVMRVPAVVGSFPEPFIHGSEGKRYPVRIDCGADSSHECSDVAKRLEDAGIAPSTSAIGAPAGKEVLRLVVGKWDEVRQDAASEQVEEGPRKSGVFARFGANGAGGYELDLLNPQAQVVRTLPHGAGLVAATRFEDQAPTWVVAGTDSTGLDRAVSLLQERILRSRFAVATTSGTPIALPVEAGG